MNAHTDMTADAAVAAATAAVRAVPVSAALVIATVAPNTKRPGTKAHAAYELYVPGQTVGDYLRAGGRRVELSWDLERGFVTLATNAPAAEAGVPEGMAHLPEEPTEEDAENHEERDVNDEPTVEEQAIAEAQKVFAEVSAKNKRARK